MSKFYATCCRIPILVASFTFFYLFSAAQNTCTAYDVGNVNNFCGCTDALFKPYGLYVEMPNGCVEYFKADTVAFIISTDSTAALKGTFRNFADFRPVLVDIRFAKTRTKIPRFELCNRDSSAAFAANWRYFGSMSGTIKFDTDPIVTVTSRNGLFQIGVGASGQNATAFGGAGQFTLSNGKVGGFGFTLSNLHPVTCPVPPSPCLNDAEPPTFSNCPSNISVTTTATTAVVNWTAPTATDNCTTPSVSSNFSSGQTFPVGITNVVYTARDSIGNRSECRFNITVTQIVQSTGCVKYDARNTNNYCGCTASQFSPYGLFLNAVNACGVDYYQTDSVSFTINADSTAALKGTFRSLNWTPIVVDIFFQKTTQRLPKFELCNRDSTATAATTWRYFGNMSGTMKIGTDAPVSVTSRNGLFQVGSSANGQNGNVLGASGQFLTSSGIQGGFGFVLQNPQNVTCLPPPNLCLMDATPPTFTNCPANISITTANTAAIATWTAPTATDNCSTPSVSSNFSSGLYFPIGTTTVIYTARDSANNTSQCQFTVTIRQVIPPTGCLKYTVDNTNNICGCTPLQFTPYGIYLQSSNACGSEFYKADTVSFQINADSTAFIKGMFRSSDWTPLVVDIFLPKTTQRLPKFENCNRDSSAAFAASWRYFGNMVGTIKLGAAAPIAVTGRNGLFQVGTGANGQNAATFGASGQFSMVNGQTGGFAFSMSNPQNVSCLPPPNLCANDAVPPTFNNCPANISITTANTTAVATWTAPTATDNCSTPSVSSNFTSGQTFGIGTTPVIYTARDSANNTSQCQFTVTIKQVIPPTGCIKYTVDNTNNYCGCTSLQYTPYGLFMQSPNACGSEFYKADSVTFQINADSTATIKGTFRSSNWTPVVVDIFMQKTTQRLPKFDFCTRDSSPAIAAFWRYFGTMSGSVKFGTDAPLSISSRNGLFQVGTGANNQNTGLVGASGQFLLGNGQQGTFGFTLTNPQNAICTTPPNFCQNDVVPPAFINCPANITVTTALTTAVATWTPPTATDNCSTPSVSSNFTSGQTFGLGTTNVIYVARDSANNIGQCQFTVTVRQVIPPSGCVKYTVDNTNNICGCTDNLYVPYGFYVETTDNSCGLNYYKADSVTFTINADSTAYLKGIFRNQSWHPILVDIYFQKTALRQPKIGLCNRDSSVANGWRYFGDMIGTIKFDNQPVVSVVSRNGVFQFGNSANNQNIGVLGASGQFTMGNGMKGGFAFSVSNPQNTACLPPPNFCLNDVIPPTFTNCPANITVNTAGTSAIVNWAAPTVIDNCTTPSVSSNYPSGRTFTLGSTDVIYTARDDAGNRSECRFTVTVNQVIPMNCRRYSVGNTQNICGCSATQWTPFGLYLENPTSNGCNIAYYKVDDAGFQINEDSSATLRGTFRSASWQPVFVNITFAKTTIKSPNIDGCNRDSFASIAANWRYFGAMRGFVQFDSSAIYNVSSGNNLTQFGIGANNQNTRELGASGSFTMSNGQKGGFNFIVNNLQAVACTTEPNPCLNDVTKPVFNNCPSTVNVPTLQASTQVNWVTPTAYDNCSSPSVTSNYTSGQTFPIGVTTVAYRATDAAGNTSICSFAVNVFRAPTQTGCNKYDVENTSNICGCADLLYKPYALYLDSARSLCSAQYFKADSVVFVANSDSTGSLKGRFRTANYLPVWVDITFARTLVKTPRLENCNRDSALTVANDWRYLGAMTGTIKFDTAAPVAISSRNGGFQFGKSASGQNPTVFGASGQFSLANGRTGGFSFVLTNQQVTACPYVPNPCLNDSIPPVFNNCPTNINIVTSQNTVAINWTTPTARDNCSSVLVLSNFQPGQLLPIGQTTIVYLARDTSGNQSECRFVVTITKVVPTQDLTNTPFEILHFSPNPTHDVLFVEATSPMNGDVVFNLTNALGQVLEQKKQTLKQGDNQLIFDVSRLPNGVYWLKPAAINGQKAMIKFVKM